MRAQRSLSLPRSPSHPPSLQLRVSNFSGSYLTLTESLCDPTNEVTFDLTVSYTENQLSVGVAGSEPITLAPPPSVPALEQLLLTLGNVPGIVIRLAEIRSNCTE